MGLVVNLLKFVLLLVDIHITRVLLGDVSVEGSENNGGHQAELYSVRPFNCYPYCQIRDKRLSDI